MTAGTRGKIIPLSAARGNLAIAQYGNFEIVERDEIASRARVAYNRQERQRRVEARRRFSLAVAILIVAGLLAAFMPWSGTGIPEAAEGQEAADVPALTVPPLSFPSVAVEEGTQTEAPFAPNAAEVEALAKMLWGEARGIASDTEKAACVWVVLNRVDDPRFPDTVLEVLEAPYQFSGYSPDYPATDELKALAADVLTRYHAERDGDTDAGRVLPSDYCWFTGDGEHNYFVNEWQSADAWGWTLESPYED